MMNLPCLAELPMVVQKVRKKHTAPSPIWNRSVSPWFSENMETLQLRVTKALEDLGRKTLLVTSAVPGEGKSVVALNLAAELARYGKKVLLIDAGLRKQDLRTYMKLLRTQHGLDDALKGTCAIDDLLCFDQQTHVFFLGGNQAVKNPAKVLSQKMPAMLAQLELQVDYIVMDAPPCGAFEDVFLMEEYADGVLFVVKQDHASQGQILEAVAELEAGDLPIIGYVFNGVSGVFSPYSYGKYGRYGKYRTYGHYKVYGEEKRPTGKDRET